MMKGTSILGTNATKTPAVADALDLCQLVMPHKHKAASYRDFWAQWSFSKCFHRYYGEIRRWFKHSR